MDNCASIPAQGYKSTYRNCFHPRPRMRQTPHMNQFDSAEIPKLSLVIPSYRSASVLSGQLPDLMCWLNTSGFTFEVIVVDDGSEDGGATRVAAQNNRCRFLELPRNQGKGGAVRAGMKAARGQFRIFTDADIPFRNEAIASFIHYLDFKEFDVVVGDRALPESRYLTEISKLRKWGSALFTLIVGRFVTTGLFDTQCGMKGFRAAIAEDLFGVGRINGFAFDVELLYIALKRNYDIKRLPVIYRGDQGPSTVSLLRHGPGMVGDLLRIKWHQVFGHYRRSPGGRK